MSFPAYPAYKDSGVEWLGAVPTYWESWKISHAFGELGSGTTPPTSEAEWYDNGTVPWVTTGELRESVILETKKLLAPTALSAFSALRLHPAGSLAIAMYGATIGRLGILGVDATTNQACCLLTRPNKLHVKFTFYWLLVFKQSIIDLYASGGGQPNINQEIIANLKVPAPGVSEQTQIARFLDHETARIDALIEEQQRLIELLKEKRQAVISHAVTKGLDPTVPMKESEISYLDKSPIHWRLKRLGDVVAFAQGKAHEPYIDDDGDFICVNSRFVSTEGKTQKYCSVNLTPASVNDILMVMSDLPNGRALARAYYVIENGRLAVNQRVCRITAEQANSRFLFYLLNRHPGLMQNDDGVNQTHLSNSDFQKLRIFLPPLSEQLKIAHYLDHVTVRIDSLISEAVIGVGLLQERRSALISAAVTGKIDVRGWQPPASTQTPEFEVAEAH